VSVVSQEDARQETVGGVHQTYLPTSSLLNGKIKSVKYGSLKRSRETHIFLLSFIFLRLSFNAHPMLIILSLGLLANLSVW
jgi:hypothetical protein